MNSNIQSYRDRLQTARSLLFVPGDRPDRFDKAMASGADVVILDLEDAVAPDNKRLARDAILGWLDAQRPVVVRINGGDTPWFEADMTLAGRPGVAGLMLPKSVSGATLSRVAVAAPTIALVETAAGIAGLATVAETAGVCRLAFGTIDLGLELGVTAGDAAFDSLRLQMVIASRLARIAPPVDGVSPDFRDPSIVLHATDRARRLGFSGKMLIHPAQIAPCHEALMPGMQAIADARAILSADAGANGAAVSLDGRMIDRPVVAQARALLTAAGLLDP